MNKPDRNIYLTHCNVYFLWLTGLSCTKETQQSPALKPLHHAENMGKVSWCSHTHTFIPFLLHFLIHLLHKQAHLKEFFSFTVMSLPFLGCSPGQRLSWDHWCQRKLTAERHSTLSGRLKRNVSINVLTLLLIWLVVLSSNCTMFFSPPPVLLTAYCQWLPESVHQEVAKSWPPL